MPVNRPIFSIDSLRSAYADAEETPISIIEEHLSRVTDAPEEIWISRVEEGRLRNRARALESKAEDGIDWKSYPLYGIPFAVKDNIDHADTPTTAGCPAYEYVPEEHATVVEKLLDAGAILVGKTNLDQFATGLVGTRSPYGACPNAVVPEYISGGSSSGSAVGVALGQVAFALGTDTAGSGRVPAAMNGIVGLKPSRGILSNAGVVPACKSLDCVAIFATSCRDALTIERVAAGFDPDDEYSRQRADEVDFSTPNISYNTVVGVPPTEQLEFFEDDAAAACFETTVACLEDLVTIETVDIEPFISAGQLLYQGPWVAERLAAIQELLTEQPDALLPVTRNIITRGRDFDASDAYNAEYKLRRIARDANAQLDAVDAILTPTTGTTYTRAEVDAKPVELNSNLGYYTNFMNLLDLSAISLPGGQRPNGMPFGVTLFADTFEDAFLATLGEQYCLERDVSIGADRTKYSNLPQTNGATTFS